MAFASTPAHNRLLPPAGAPEEQKRTAKDAEKGRGAQRRAIGNMIFVGFLWRKSILGEKVVHMCMGELLTDPGSEELECAAQLLATVGSYLEACPMRFVAGCS